MSDRFRGALTDAWRKIEERQWIYGKPGKLNTDASYTYAVPGRAKFIYVTIRNAGGAQSAVPARNDALVPLDNTTVVKMRLEKGVYVIHGVSGRPEQGGSLPENTGGNYTFLELTDVPAAYTGSAGSLLAVNGTEDGVEFTPFPDADDIAESATRLWFDPAEAVKLAGIESLADVTDQANVGAAIDTSPEQTVLASGNKIALTDAGVLKWADWDTIVAEIGGGSFVDLTTNQDVGGIKTFTGGITKLDSGASGFPYLTWNQNAVNRFLIGVAASADDFVVGTSPGDVGLTAFGQDILFSIDSGVTPHLTLSPIMTKFAGNAWGEFSSSLKYGFYTGQDVEVMGNAYWNGSGYYRYGVGRSSKITLGDDGHIYFSATNTSGAADTAITGTPGAYEAKGIITASGNWGVNTFAPVAVFDIMIPGVASSAMLVGYGGTSTYIRAGTTAGGLHLGDFNTLYVALGESGVPVIVGGTVNHGQVLTINKAAGAPGIEWSISDVAKAFVGVAQAADHWIAGAISGDFNIRSEGGSILLSTDSGASWGAILNTSEQLYVKGGLFSYSGAGGFATVMPGDASHSGYLEWKNSSATRLAYMGFDNTELTLVLENGADFLISGGIVQVTNNSLTVAPLSLINLSGLGPAINFSGSRSGASLGVYGGKIMVTVAGHAGTWYVPYYA